MKTRTLWLTALALLAILLISGTVFAEGEEPPVVPEQPAAAVEAPPPPAVQESPVEAVTVVEEAPPPAEHEPEAPAAEPQAVEEAPLTEAAPAAEEAAITDPAPEPVEEVLTAEETLPASEVLPITAGEPVLVDAAGEPLVLATEEAAELLIAPDPYFTTGVGATTYSFTALDCDPDTGGNQPCANPLLAAIAYIDTNALVPDGGSLYVQKATYTGNITIDYLTNPNLSSLTGLIGEPLLGINPTISGSLTLNNLLSGFSLTNFNITGGVFINNSDGQFYIDNVSAPLSMTDVDASGTGGHGIAINNSKGNIILTRVTANNNNELGVFILNHAGHIFFDTVTVNDNGANGAAIINDTGIYNITIKNSVFNHNGLNEGISGSLSIWSNGLVTLNGVVANDSNDSFGGSGIRVRSGGASLRNVIANNNAGDGIHVQLRSGSILLENAVASNNGSIGVNVELRDKYDNEIFYPANVTIKNMVANDNNFNGLLVRTLGTVTINNSSTNGNTNGDGTKIETNGAVTVTGMESFNNGENGLFVRTKGAITITGIYASNNGLSGADLDNGLCTFNEITELWSCLGTGGIQVKNTSGWMSDLSNNQHFGLWAVSKGAITVTNLRANENGSDGAFLWNDRGGSTAAITVNTLGAVRNDFYRNCWNSEFWPGYPDGGEEYWVRMNGLTALSGGNITVSNTSASDGGGGIVVSSQNSITPKTVTLTNVDAYGNSWIGIKVWAKGNVTLNYVYGNGNDVGGINVDNCLYNDGTELCAGIGTVYLSNVDTFENGGLGIEVNSKSTITLLNANACNNGDVGISLINNYSGATAGVTLTNISANDNNNTGLSVITNGSALLTSISTHNNAKRNGTIDTGQTVQDFFNQNHGPDMWWFEGIPGTTYDFKLQSDALWNLNRADFDPWIELYDANDPESPLSVEITCDDENTYCSFSFSPGDAPFSYTEATKFFVKVGSYSNDGFYHLSLGDEVPDDSTDMFWSQGTGITAGGSITVRGIDSSNNSLTGLSAGVTGNGSITLSDLGINNNGAEGVYLTCGQLPDFSESGFGTGSISITGSNWISDNGWDGLMMATSGNVTISNLDASWNGRNTGSGGIAIRDDTVAKAVTLSGISAGENGATGLFINATGNVSLSNANFWNNLSGAGVDIANDFGSGTIRLTNVSSNNNQGIGIDLYSRGLITLSGVEVNGNWGPGISLKNDYDGATAGITLSTVRAESNGDTGIIAHTNGALLMSNITANSNYLTWGEIDSGTTVQNYYSSNREPDHWWFEATEGVPITLKLWADGINDLDWLNRWDFDPFLRIFDAGDTEITSNQAITFEYSGTDWFSTDFYEIVWTPGSGESGWFYLEVSSDNGNSGFYRMSVDDSDPTDALARYVDGLAYHAGGSVALSGLNNFSDNEQAGLIGWNSGNVTLANFFVWGNGCEGIYLDNTGGSGNILINGTNGSGGNGWEGLRVMTDGAVTISNLEANNNGQDGLWITANTALKAVTLNNIVAMWNSINGLNLTTHGITTLNNVRAWFNGNDGANVSTNGYNLNVLNSSFICNDHFGLAYANLPVVFFTNTNNIYLCNGTADLWVINP